jgi:hypothetical protein
VEALILSGNRTKKAPEKAYSVKEAVEYVGWIGGPKRAPSDGPPGVKTIWPGLQKFYTLFEYRDMFNFMALRYFKWVKK